MADKPPFDPNKPFEEDKPPFDPSGEFQVADQGFEDGSVFIDPTLDFPGVGRTRAKMFGTDSQSQIKFLKKVNPNIDFTSGPGGEVLFKDPSGKLGYIDKPFSESVKDPKELFQDVLDLGYDVPAGIAQGAATAAGGLAGGLPGAMAAGAASGAGLEKIRQSIGSAMMDQAGDPTSVGMSALFGAISPALFGSGATSGGIAQKALISGKPLEQVTKEQSGLLSRGYEKFGPKISSFFTKAEEPEIRWMKNNLPKIREMEKNPEMYAQKLMSDRQTLVDATNSLGDSAGKNIDKVIGALDQNGVRINVESFAKPINELKSKLIEMSKKEQVPKSLMDEISAIESEIAQELSSKKTGLSLNPETLVLSEQTTNEPLKDVSASLAKKIKDNFNRIQREHGLDIAKTGNIEGIGKAGTTKGSKDIAAAFGKAAGAIEDQIESKSKNFKIEVDGKTISLGDFYKQNKELYGSVQDIENELKSSTKEAFSVDRYKNFIDRFKKPENIILRKKLEEITGKNLGELGTEIRSFAIFSRLKDPTLSFKVPEKLGRTALSTAAGFGMGNFLTGGGFTPLATSAALGYGLSRPATHRAGFALGNFLEKIPRSGNIGLGITPFGAGAGIMQRQMLPWSLMNTEEEKK